MYLVGWSLRKTLAGESFKIYTPLSVHVTLEAAQSVVEFVKGWLQSCEEYQIDSSIQVEIRLIPSRFPVLPATLNVEAWRREITSRRVSKDTVEVELVWSKL